LKPLKKGKCRPLSKIGKGSYGLKKKEKQKHLSAYTEVPTQIKNPALVKEKRRKIIDVTVKLFIEHGYHKTTTRMIAKAASFSMGSLYEYVGSKENLLYLVCKTIHEEVQEVVENALNRQDSGKERLARVIRHYFYVCDNMADHILLMYQVTQFLPGKWQGRVLENELHITDIFINVLSSLSGKNGFPVLEKKVLNLVGHNISVLGQMWGFRRWHMQKDFSIEEYIKIQTDFILGQVF
jgi:TetR/AcrR family transcriptional regulator, cholesterol catabolism regulator